MNMGGSRRIDTFVTFGRYREPRTRRPRGDRRSCVLELRWTEIKVETAINRVTGAARPGSLREIERVPAGARFKECQFIFTVFMNFFIGRQFGLGNFLFDQILDPG